MPASRGKKLLLAGMFLFVVGLLGTLTLRMLATLYVPICQQGAEWIREGGRGLLRFRLAAGMWVTPLGALLFVCGAVVQLRARRRPDSRNSG